MRLTDVGWSALVCTEQVQVFRTQEDYTEGRLSSFKSGKIIAGEIIITVNCEPCKPSLAESKKVGEMNMNTSGIFLNYYLTILAGV